MQFTRYLYIRDEVEYSLLISLLKSEKESGKIDEILFWAYELYFSGWEEDTFALVHRIYDDFYRQLHPTLNAMINKKYKEWRTTRDPCLLGTILHNMVNKTYCTDVFLQKYIPRAFSPQNHVIFTKRSKYIIVMTEEELEKYKTVEIEDPDKPWHVLRNVCQFSTYRTSHKQSVFVFKRKDALFRFREKWLYYAANTPIWNRRIAKYEGSINHTKKCVDFANEDAEEEFYNLYNYEPDEQPTEVLEKCVGQTTRHGELKLLRVACVIDFSGNEVDIESAENDENVTLPPPPPAIEYFM